MEPIKDIAEDKYIELITEIGQVREECKLLPNASSTSATQIEDLELLDLINSSENKVNIYTKSTQHRDHSEKGKCSSINQKMIDNKENSSRVDKQNIGPSIKIPTRYYSLSETDPTEFIIAQSNSGGIFRKSEISNEFLANSIEDIHKRFESLRKEEQEKSIIKHQKILKKSQIKLEKLTIKTSKNLKRLSDLEGFSILKLKESIHGKTLENAFQSNSNILTNDQNNITLQNFKHLSQPLSESNSPILLNVYKEKCFISSDMKTCRKFSIPFSLGSSYLVLNRNTILICQSESLEILKLDLDSENITSLVPLTKSRKYAAFGYIDNYPALIGGIIDQKNNLTDSVEILKDLKTWVNISSLNRARSHGQTLKHNECTYVFAGFPFDITNTIEVFKHGHWETFGFRFSEKFNCFGIASYDDWIITFGGMANPGKQLRNKIVMINTQTMQVKEQGLRSLFISNCVQSSKVVDGVLIYLDGIHGKIVSQELEF